MNLLFFTLFDGSKEQCDSVRQEFGLLKLRFQYSWKLTLEFFLLLISFSQRCLNGQGLRQITIFVKVLQRNRTNKVYSEREIGVV